MSKLRWAIVAAAVAVPLSLITVLVAASAGEIVGKNALGGTEEGRHWGILPFDYLSSRGNSCLIVERYIDGERVEIIVSPAAWERKRVGDSYYGEW